MWKKQHINYITNGLLHKKHIFIYIIASAFIIGSLFLLNFSKANGDLMEQAFETARSYDTIVDLGNTKDAVGNGILRESASVGISENGGKGCFVNGQYVNLGGDDQEAKLKCEELGGDRNVSLIDIQTKEPLLVRITKFLLRMTIVLSISMVIYNAILYMLEVLKGKDRKSTEAMKNIMRVVGGIIVALMSVAIINLVISIPKSSIKTSDDLGGFEIGCQVDATIIAGNDLKKWVCENVLEGARDETKIFKRCIVDGEGQNISNDEMESACVLDMGGSVVK